jgi:hypothetical protein
VVEWESERGGFVCAYVADEHVAVGEVEGVGGGVGVHPGLAGHGAVLGQVAQLELGAVDDVEQTEVRGLDAQLGRRAGGRVR